MNGWMDESMKGWMNERIKRMEWNEKMKKETGSQKGAAHSARAEGDHLSVRDNGKEGEGRTTAPRTVVKLRFCASFRTGRMGGWGIRPY